MKKLMIGQIVNVVGLKGEVKVHSDSNNVEKGMKLLLEENEYLVENARYQKGMMILKLEGVNDRNAAEAMRGKNVFIAEENLKELPEDTFYIKDVVGLRVVHAKTGQEIGKVKDVITGSAQDIYVIALMDGNEAMVPGVKEFIKGIKVDKEAPNSGFVKIEPIPGLIDLDFLEVGKDD